jgi:hypothetical protein
MSTANTIPLVNGDGTKFALTLTLPASYATPINGSAVTWASTAHSGAGGHVGVLSPSNDGLSCLYTVGSTMVTTDTETITATLTTGTAGLVSSWQAGKLYRLGDKIIAKGHIQQVTTTSRFIPTVYTPEANLIPSLTPNISTPSALAGDAGWFKAVSAERAAGNYAYTIDPNGLNFILNQGDGDINGDWPLGALLPLNADTNQQGSKTGAYLNSAGAVVSGLNPGIVSAAPVTLVGAGFSTGANFTVYPGSQEAGTAQGIETPQTYGNDTRTFNAEYSELGAGAKGTFVISGATYPSVLAGAGYTDYAGTFTGGGSNAFAGLTFTIAGFATNASNNGAFLCTASTAILLTVANASGITEVHAATATNTGVRAYLDPQGNAHVGWQVARGSQDYTQSVAVPPSFSTSGGTTVDNELIWTDEGAAATTATVATVLTLTTGAAAPLGYSVPLG